MINTSEYLTSKQIKERLHVFNLTNNFDVFSDVSPTQQLSVMYPSVANIGMSDDEYKQSLIKLFGELNQELFNKFNKK